MKSSQSQVEVDACAHSNWYSFYTSAILSQPFEIGHKWSAYPVVEVWFWKLFICCPYSDQAAHKQILLSTFSVLGRYMPPNVYSELVGLVNSLNSNKELD